MKEKLEEFEDLVHPMTRTTILALQSVGNGSEEALALFLWTLKITLTKRLLRNSNL